MFEIFEMKIYLQFISVKAVVHPEPCQNSKTEHFAKIVTRLKTLTIFAKSFILDTSHGSGYVPEVHLRISTKLQTKI